MQEKNFKILVVDDIEDNLTVIGNTFSEKNISLTFAMEGKQAIKIAEKKQPDLILLDINMPEMNGFEVCKKLKESPATKDIPVIFLSAYTEKEDIIKGFEYGAVDYITKPFHKAELLSRVDIHLELKFSKDLLKKKNLELEEANSTKDKFFSIISHDLKSPFNTLIGFSELLLNNHTKYDDNKRELFINNINLSAKNAYKLLENLLTWARIQSGHISFSINDVNVNSVAKEACAFLKYSAKEKSIELLNNSKPDYIVKADRNMLSTILRNLLSNAIKFTKNNGTVCINNIISKDEKFIEISVTDTGLGIANEKLNKLFRIDKNISTVGTNNEMGTGLGLILCKEFVEKLGGSIWVSSEQEKGSTFTFSLPL